MRCETCQQSYASARDTDDSLVRDLCACEERQLCGFKQCRRPAAVARLNEDDSVDKYYCLEHGPIEALEHASPTAPHEEPKKEARLHTDAELRTFAKQNDFRMTCSECKHVHKDSERTYFRTNLSVMTGCPKCKNPAYRLVD